MTKDFSNIFEGKQVVRGRSITGKIGNAGFLAKTVGIVITGVMLLGFCGTMMMGWLIKSGLNDLANRQEIKFELTKIEQNLEMQKQQLLNQNSIKIAAGGIGLYPHSSAQVRQL